MQEKTANFIPPLRLADVDTEFRRVLRSAEIRSPIFPAFILAGLVMTSADMADTRRVSWDQVK